MYVRSNLGRLLQLFPCVSSECSKGFQVHKDPHISRYGNPFVEFQVLLNSRVSDFVYSLFLSL
jgi:hypothetical protein